MSRFVVPQMPLHVSVWHFAGGTGKYALPDVKTFGNLSPGKRVMIGGINTSTTIMISHEMELLVPKLTDIQCDWNLSGQTDTIECPAGSHRFYRVDNVDDVAKGFANEYRIVWMNYLMQGQTFVDTGPIAAPVPLP